MAGESNELDYEKIKDYAANASRVGGALSALFKHDGWQIFLALYKRKKDEIKEKREYADISDFHADRKALDIIDELFHEMEGFVEEASDATAALAQVSPQDNKPRGIMLIETMEEVNRES